MQGLNKAFVPRLFAGPQSPVRGESRYSAVRHARPLAQAAGRLTSLLLLLCLISCGGGGGGTAGTNSVADTPTPPPPVQPDPPVSASDFSGLVPVLDAFDNDEFSFVLGDATGIRFTYTRGNTSIDDVKRIASSSKWYTSAVVMALVEQGVMSLQDRPQDYIEWWTDEPSDPRSRITLAHLLAQTSGLALDETEAFCARDATDIMENCARHIYDIGTSFEPGEVFFYNSAHFQVAGHMVQLASGQDYQELFNNLVAVPLGMSRTEMRISNTQNPNLAGGYVSTARDSARWLQAILAGELILGVRDEWEVDRTPFPVRIEKSPVNLLSGTPEGQDLGLAWHYALGHWRECPQDEWDENCDPLAVVSSPGALGWYPWIDYSTGCFGVVAVEQEDLTQLGFNGIASIALGYEIRDELSNILAAGEVQCEN